MTTRKRELQIWVGGDHFKEFDIFITVDRNLAFQQHLPEFDIAVLVLHAPSNRLDDLKNLIPKIIVALPELEKGKATFIKT